MDPMQGPGESRAKRLSAFCDPTSVPQLDNGVEQQPPGPPGTGILPPPSVLVAAVIARGLPPAPPEATQTPIQEGTGLMVPPVWQAMATMAEGVPQKFKTGIHPSATQPKCVWPVESTAPGVASLSATPPEQPSTKPSEWLKHTDYRSRFSLENGPTADQVKEKFYFRHCGWHPGEELVFWATTLDTGEGWGPRLCPVALASPSVDATGQVFSLTFVGLDRFGVLFVVELDFCELKGLLRRVIPDSDEYHTLNNLVIGHSCG